MVMMIKLRIFTNNDKEWIYNGTVHRLNGPAITAANRATFWYKHGRRHRTNGPARIRPNMVPEYWINGKLVSEFELMFMNECV